MHSFLVCPVCKQLLQIDIKRTELNCFECSLAFPTQILPEGCEYTSFAKTGVEEINKNEIIYEASQLNEKYQNFLNWLFQTFKVEEEKFRWNMFKNLQFFENMNVLITSVGNGDDIINLVRLFPDINLNIYAQDISVTMCEFALSRLKKLGIQIKEMNVSDLAALPYKSNFFDVVFHFGGINLISNKAKALSEMVRVAKDFGQIAVSDESVGPWLRNSTFGKVMINNNSLWAAEIPLDILPTNINKVKVEYLLENCFYFISFVKDPKFPNIDLDVRHIGPRGGSIRTRYFGKIEGIDPLLKEAVRKAAIAKGMSEVDWLEITLRKELHQGD